MSDTDFSLSRFERLVAAIAIVATEDAELLKRLAG